MLSVSEDTGGVVGAPVDVVHAENTTVRRSNRKTTANDLVFPLLSNLKYPFTFFLFVFCYLQLIILLIVDLSG